MLSEPYAPAILSHWRETTVRRFLIAALVAPVLVLPVASSASAACSHVPSDFNGDGYGDLAVGSPQRLEPVDDIPWEGALHVAYGSATGLANGATKSLTLNGRTSGLPDQGFRSSARLGESLASGDFDGDCYADLAVSAASVSDTLILYGSQLGLTTTRSAAFDRTAIQPDGAYGSGLSYDLTSGDFNGDGFSDLAAGAPWAEDSSGAFGVLYGSSTGITSTGAQWITQDSPNVPGSAERDDLLGWALSAGDFNGDGFSDLAAGAPGETIGSSRNAGGVTVFPGTAGGLATAGSTWWDQNSPGVPGAVEALDRFGYVLAAGDTNGDGRAELVVAAPEEAIGEETAAGMVNVFHGAASGLLPGPSFDQGQAEIPGAAESGDYFGSALALVDLNRDGKQDLAVGVRGEWVGSAQGTGAVNVLHSTTSGPTATGALYIDQNSAGVPGANENLDAFGWSLSRLPNAYGGDALAIGAPDENVTFPWEGAVTVLPSAAEGAARPSGYFFSGANFPGGAAAESNFGTGLP